MPDERGIWHHDLYKEELQPDPVVEGDLETEPGLLGGGGGVVGSQDLDR